MKNESFQGKRHSKILFSSKSKCRDDRKNEVDIIREWLGQKSYSTILCHFHRNSRVEEKMKIDEEIDQFKQDFSSSIGFSLTKIWLKLRKWISMRWKMNIWYENWVHLLLSFPMKYHDRYSIVINQMMNV